MLTLSEHLPIYLYLAPVDMRKSFNGLGGLIDEAQLDLLGGGLFVFVNRLKNRMKVLAFEGDGLAIWYKHLEAGRFQWPHVNGKATTQVKPSQLRMILDGIDWHKATQRKRYHHRHDCG